MPTTGESEYQVQCDVDKGGIELPASLKSVRLTTNHPRGKLKEHTLSDSCHSVS